MSQLRRQATLSLLEAVTRDRGLGVRHCGNLLPAVGSWRAHWVQRMTGDKWDVLFPAMLRSGLLVALFGLALVMAGFHIVAAFAVMGVGLVVEWVGFIGVWRRS